MKFGKRVRRALRGVLSNKTASDRASSPDSTKTEQIRQTLTDIGYYEAVSARYGAAQLIGIVLLALYLALTLLTDSSMLAGGHLTYFLKDMTNAMTLREATARDTLVYTADEDGQQTLFRDGLVAVGGDRVTVFSSTGRIKQDRSKQIRLLAISVSVCK